MEANESARPRHRTFKIFLTTKAVEVLSSGDMQIVLEIKIKYFVTVYTW